MQNISISHNLPLGSDLSPLIVLIVVALIVGGVVWGIVATARRRKELAEWAAAHRFTFSPDKDYGMMNRLPWLKALRKGDNQYAYNILEGMWDDAPMTGFDYHYETHSTDSKGHRQTHHHHFSAVAIVSDVPLKPLSLRPEGLLDKIGAFVGIEDIDFESAEFSSKFCVKSPDRRWAYDVIHPRLMEFLLAAPRFHIEMDRREIVAYRSSNFRVGDFEAAAQVCRSFLAQMPEYLKRQQAECFAPDRSRQ